MPSPNVPAAIDRGPLDGLTSKQWLFVQAVFAGADHTSAYRQVYSAENMAPHTVHTAADELMRHPAIKAKLSAMRQKVEAQSTLAPLVTREFVLNGIMQLAVHADKDSTKLRAFELLGKTVGVDLFRDHVVTTKEERSVADIERELKEKLASLRQTIDGTATPVTSTPGGGPAPRKRKPRT